MTRDIKEAVPDWVSPPSPPADLQLTGRYARLEPLHPRWAGALFAEISSADTDAGWQYLSTGPYRSETEFGDWLKSVEHSTDPHFFVIRRQHDSRPVGFCSYLRITPQQGSIEVGFIHFGPGLQQSPAATEAMFLMMNWAFDAGYRRYEWKCDAANMPSRRAAQRLGFSYEGTFRQAMIVKGLNRDTAWFAMIDREWPVVKAAFETWLDPSNFDASGQQKARLSHLTAPHRVASDPALE